MDLRRTPIARLGLAAVALLAAGTLAGCSDDGERAVGRPPAATVDGTAIPESEVVALSEANQAYYRQAIEAGDDTTGELQQLLDDSTGDGEGTIAMTEASASLRSLIVSQVIRDELARLDALPSDADRDAVRAQLAENLGGEEEVEKLPDDLLSSYIDSQSLFSAFQASLAAEQDEGVEPLDPAEREAQMRELYEQVAPGLPMCLNALLVDTEEEAASASARVAGGEPFATVAQDVSLDETSAEAGGFLRCLDPAQSETTLGIDLTGYEVGQLTAPVQVGQGETAQYAIFQVESLDGPTYEQLLPQLEQQIPAEPVATDPAEVDVEGPLLALLEAADITVDPKFGTWDPATGSIVAPDAPAEVDATTTIPGVATIED